MKKNFSIFLMMAIFASLSATAALAEGLVCATCGKVIVGSYKEYIGQPYCSLECIRAALPKCSVCGKPAQEQIRVAGDTGKVYCSLTCFQTILPICEICGKSLEKWVAVSGHKYCHDCAGLPTCFNCRLPGADQALADRRHICSKCLKEAINDQDYAKIIFQQVRGDMYSHLNLRSKHMIQFFMVDANGLASILGHRNSSEQGYYSYQAKYRIMKGVKKVESETCAIYILSALSPPYFRNAAAHELAHDIGQVLYPHVRRKEDIEGFAEYIASLMNSYWGHSALNREKLLNREADYAQAYGKFLRIAGNIGLPNVLAYMENNNR